MFSGVFPELEKVNPRRLFGHARRWLPDPSRLRLFILYLKSLTYGSMKKPREHKADRKHVLIHKLTLHIHSGATTTPPRRHFNPCKWDRDREIMVLAFERFLAIWLFSLATKIVLPVINKLSSPYSVSQFTWKLPKIVRIGEPGNPWWITNPKKEAMSGKIFSLGN